MDFEKWIQNNSHQIFLCILFIYVFLAILAPVLMKIGWEIPAKCLYWIYSHTCHQFAYRSWFLFGMQPYYPFLQTSNGSNTSYQEAFGTLESDEIISRSVIGNEKYGYKMAFCQRDLAMYTSLLLFGSLYLLTGKKIQRIPFLLWLTLGILPLGIDGFIQLIGNKWESTPYLRTITGMMFGLFSGWFLFPSLESINKE